MSRTEEILNRPTNEQGNGSNSTEQTGAERLNTIIDDLKKQNQQTGAERLNAIINSLKNQNKPKQQSQFQDAPVFSKLKEQQQKQNSWESRGWDYEKDEIAGEVQKVNDEYINQYIQNIQNYAKSAPDAYKNASYGDMNVFLEQHQHETYELQKQGDAIKKYLESNPNAYAENRQSLMDFLTSNNEAVSAYRNMLNNAEAGNSLYIPTTAEERQDKYESNQKKIDELTYNGLLEDFFLSDEDKAKVDRLRKENKDYELGQGGYATTKKADEYSKVMQNEDFGTVSAKRPQPPTKEDIAQYDAMNDSTKWYYDENGVLRDAFGNEIVTDKNGEQHSSKAQQYPVTDRLGLYLSASKDEIKDYMVTLSSGVWTSVINDALDGSWDYLTKDDIGVYYYILNKEGQAAADKYLDDMKLELNRRETMSDQQRWTEKYNNSNWLQKIGMNAETLPAKFLSGTAGFVDNTVKALTGNEVNPYDAVHSGTYFTNTVRGETAKELDKTGFELPLVNFTLGDIYQTGMSRLDSALATAIFGGGGTVFLGMQAAEQEALKLYEKGANETQITLGALAAGLAETIFEYASFGELQNLKNASKGEIEGWAKRALKNAWSQGMDEAREETLTGLTNLVTNALIMGKDSDLAEMYKENKDEAFGLFKDLLQQTAHDALGGFIGGAGAGLTQTAGQYLQNYNQIRNAKKFGNTQKTQQAQQQSAPEVQVPTAESTGAQLQNIKEMAKAKLEALGETKGAEAIAEAIAKQVSGEKLTTTEELLINDSHNSRQVLQDMSEIAQKQAQPVDTQAQTSYDNKNTNEDYEAAMEYRDSLLNQKNAEKNAAEANQNSTLPETAVGAMKSRFEHEVKRSKLYDNTYKNAASEEVRAIGEKAELFDENVANYEKITNAESMMEAKLRTRSPEEIGFEYEDLINKDGWGASDNDTAWLILDYLSKNKDYAKFVKLANKQREQATRGGQLTQSFAKYSRTPVKAAVDAVNALDAMDQSSVPKNFWKKQGFEAWKKDVGKTILDIQQQIEAVDDGNTAEMKNIIRSLAKFRKTTAWFGMSSDLAKAAERALKDIDFQTAKDIAAAQMSKIPDDFVRRPVGKVIKTIRIHNMLSGLTTVNRNLFGNAGNGMTAAVSDSTVGLALDALVAKATGIRAVGNDIKYAKEYVTGGIKAANMAALCVELDIPLESESAYSTGHTRTYSAAGGPVSRFMSAFEKYMKYALEVTDKFFEGGTESAVQKSLDELGEKSNLTEEQKASISKVAGKQRTFKDDGKLAEAGKGLKRALNKIGTENVGAGDFMMPFVGIGANVAQTAIDYNSLGVGGFVDIVRLISDVKHGKYKDGVKKVYEDGKVVKEISLAEAQRRAVTKAGRGITGAALISMFAALAFSGIIKVSNDEDKDRRGLEQAANLSGAQFNIDAAIRGLTGGSTEWQEDDVVLSIDFLEPFNAQMYVGCLLAQEDSVADMLKKLPGKAVQGVFESLVDMPMMQGMSDMVDLVEGIGESFSSEDGTAWEDAAGQLLGNQASSFIPSWMRQTAQFIDPYYRDTTGDGFLEKSVNQMVAAIPFASQTLPKKYSGLGEEQLRYENEAMGFFNTFINPGDISQISPNEITQYLGELSEKTGSASMYPDATAPNKFTYKDEKGNSIEVKIEGKEMTETYQKTYGDTVSELYSDFISNEYFNTLDDKTKTELFESAKSYAASIAKAAVSDYDNVPKYIAERPAGMTVTEAIMRQKLVGGVNRFGDKSVKDAAELVAAINAAVDGLTPQSGYESVRTVQKVDAITAADDLLTAQEQADAIRDVLSDGFGERYDKVIAMGYDNDDFAKVYSIYTQDQDSKDIDKDDALKMIMRELNITKSQARKLYDAYTAPKDNSK